MLLLLGQKGVWLVMGLELQKSRKCSKVAFLPREFWCDEHQDEKFVRILRKSSVMSKQWKKVAIFSSWLFSSGRSNITVYENRQKSRIQHCERSELHLHFEWTKSSLKRPKMVNFGEFLKSWNFRSNRVTRQVSFNRTKIGGKCQN